MNKLYWQLLIPLFFIIMIPRALPFFIAHRVGDNIKKVGRVLPGFIMFSLVIYEIGMSNFIHFPYAIPDIIGLLFALFVYHISKNMLLSLLLSSGTFFMTH